MKNRASLVSQGQQAKPHGQRPAADVTAWEREIDLPREIGREVPAHLGSRRLVSRGERVYRPYGLTPAEIKIVEEGGGKDE